MSPETNVCTLYRAELLDFVDTRRRQPGTEAAFEHLERCPGCRADLEATALAIVALRRIHTELVRLEAPAAAWPKLRDRVERKGARFEARAAIGSLVASAAVVAMLVSTHPLRAGSFATSATDTAPVSALTAAEWQQALVEHRLLDHGNLPVPPDAWQTEPEWVTTNILRWPGPDGRGTSGASSTDGAPPRRK